MKNIFNILGSKRVLLTIVAVFSFSFFSYIPAPEMELGVKTVVIDAGHGGHDSGCLGASAQEKHVALGIALKLGKFIQKNFKDVKVIYTRDKDEFVTLSDRAKIANENKADLFICIHANSGSPSAYGSETYVMGLHKEEAHFNVAKRENSSILMEDNYEATYEGFDPNSPESYIALSLMQGAFLNQSISFAAKIQDQFKQLGRRDRGVKQAGFLVLYRTTMPSVLIETGFLTNPNEEKFLAKEENQEKMAGSIFEAFKQYKAEIESVPIESFGKTKSISDNKKDAIKIESPSRDLYPKSSKEEETSKTKGNNSKNELGDVIYRVQVSSSSNKIELKPENFKKLPDPFMYEQSGMYKYTVGATSNLEEAITLQEQARKKGFKGAFLVAFYKGEKISVSKAKELQKAQ